MRICHLAAGAGSMQCGACKRDSAMARSLIARGHDVQIVPLYTPLHIEGDDPPPMTRVRLGALNAYAQQVSGIFAHLPRPLARLLDNEALLRAVSRFAVRTRPAQVGPMTVSVLRGIDGRQRTEFEHLLRFIEEEARPDVVGIANSLLSAVAPVVKQRLGLRIFCEVKGEDGFIEGTPEPYRSEALELMRHNARFIDRFTAPNRACAELMADLLQVEPERFEVVRSIVDRVLPLPGSERIRDPFTIGYLSVITPRKGLHLLVEAIGSIVREGCDARLLVAGQVLDRGYWREIRREVRRKGLRDRFDYLGEIDFETKLKFLRSLSAFCQPSILPEALGTASLEAMAAGVPIVAPGEGAFPEMLGLTEGGLLFEPRKVSSLVAAIAWLMNDPEGADRLGISGINGTRRYFSGEQAARQMESMLDSMTGKVSLKGAEAYGEETVQVGKE